MMCFYPDLETRNNIKIDIDVKIINDIEFRSMYSNNKFNIQLGSEEYYLKFIITHNYKNYRINCGYLGFTTILLF